MHSVRSPSQSMSAGQLTVRPAGHKEVPAVAEFYESSGAARFYGKADLDELVENASVAVVAVDPLGTIVGFLALTVDAPPPVNVSSRELPPDEQARRLKWVLSEAEAMAYRPESSLWLRLFAGAPGSEAPAALVLLRAALASVSHVTAVLYACPAGLKTTESAPLAFFEPITASPQLKLATYRLPRAAILPPASVRRARVEDHDDLAPILESARARYADLTDLPAWANPGEPFGLARLIAGQDATSAVLVAEVNGKPVGFLALSAAVDGPRLQASFDLAAFDDLAVPIKASDKTAAASAAEEAAVVAAEASAEAEAALEAVGASPPLTLPPRPSTAAPPPVAGTGVTTAVPRPSSGPPAIVAAAPPQQPQPTPAVDDDAQEDSEDEDAAAARADAVAAAEEAAALAADAAESAAAAAAAAGAAGAAKPPVSAFTVTMLCLAVGYSALAPDFLAPAFACYPGRLYCAVELPHIGLEPPLVQQFTRVPSHLQAAHPTVLYVFHRAGLLPDFVVRPAMAADAKGAAALVEGLESAPAIAAALAAAPFGSAFVATCQSAVVGLAVLEPRADLAKLRRNFDLDAVVKGQYHAAHAVASLAHVALDPVFNHRRKLFLAEVMRQKRATLLVLRVPFRAAAPSLILQDFYQAPVRYLQGPASDPEDAAAVYLLTRRLASSVKLAVNHRIVVVGASDTGLACIESLLLQEALSFSALILLAYGGVTAGGASAQYTVAALAKLGLENRVDVIDADMVALDREDRTAYLSDGTVLPYDALVLCNQLQDQTFARLGESCDPGAHAVRAGRELGEELRGGRVDLSAGAVVYGGTLTAAIAAQALVAAGMEASAVKVVRPPSGLYHTAALAHHAQLEVFGRHNDGVLPTELPAATLVKVARTAAGGAAVTLQLAGTGDIAVESVGLLVVADVPDVDGMTFAALNDASIVYDGRVVVDGSFRTNDAAIYAAGHVAKLSRRYAAAAPGGLMLETYSAREVGFRLADVLVARFSGAAISEAMPELSSPKVVSGILPGNMQFIYAAMPAVYRAMSPHPPPGGRKLETRVEGMCRLDLDAAGVVVSALYFGKRRLDKAKLAQIVGLPATYLDRLVPKYDAGEVQDLLLYLAEGWAAALYHDAFPGLVRSIASQLQVRALADMAEAAAEGDKASHELLGAKAKRLVQDCILEFVSTHRAELPTYHLPV